MSSFSKKPHSPRFNTNADALNEILQYVQNRCTQSLSCEGFHYGWNGNYESILNDSVIRVKISMFENQQQQEQEIENFVYYYVRPNYRKDEKVIEFILNESSTIIVEKDSFLLEHLKEKKTAFWEKCNFVEYQAVEKSYGDHHAERTGVHLINHIDEGMYILKKIGASELAQRAYILHPLIQGDAEIKEFWDNELNDENRGKWDIRVIMLAVEYRNIANAYLSHCPSTETFALSSLKEVNQMLIADKIQNRKDFERYHILTHPKTNRLQEYFGQWLKRLEIPEETYQQTVQEIYSFVGGNSKFLL